MALGLDAPCDSGHAGLGVPVVTVHLVPTRAQGQGQQQFGSSPLGTAVIAAGGPGAESHAGRDADAAGEQNWIHVNF